MIIALGSFLLTVSIKATVLVYDPFTYTDGPLVPQGAGLWGAHSGSEDEIKVSNNRIFLTGDGFSDVSTALGDSSIPPTSTNALYLSMIFKVLSLPPGDGNYFAHFRSGNVHRGRLFVSTNGATEGTFNIGVSNGRSAVSTNFPGNLSTNVDYRIVMRYVVNTATTTLWLAPATEDNARITATDAASPSSVTSFALRQANTIGSLSIKSVLVGTRFKEVVRGNPAPEPPTITLQPKSQSVNEGGTVTFTTAAEGAEPLSYQWRLNYISLKGQTNSTLVLSNVTTALAGVYSVVVRNGAGSDVSPSALLRLVAPLNRGSFTLMTYNVHGNGVTDWGVDVLQVEAIGRQLAFLQPDIIALNEIPQREVHQMTNFVAAYLPDYSLATNSGTDGYIRSVLLSRFPIRRSQRWLDGVSLSRFGFNGRFARDLFEAEIDVPEFDEPLHIFVAHLKAFADAESAAQRAAEASAVSNFLATQFIPNNPGRPYVLVGDLNEDINRPPTTSQQPIQRLANAATGLAVSTPLNPFTQDDRTISIQKSLTVRFDYILPSGLLFTNILDSQVFRSDLLNPMPVALLATDSVTASDHLPVVMTFRNPFSVALHIESLTESGESLTLKWKGRPGQLYTVETSVDLLVWKTVVSGASNNATLSRSQVGTQFFRVRTD